MNYDKTVRDAIEKQMQRDGINQLELAKRVGMSPQYVSDVLSGRRGKLPKSVAAILKELGLELVVKPGNE